jgi:hypothetical protein
VCFDFLCNICLKNVSFQEEFSEIWSEMYIGLHVNYPLLLCGFNGTGISSTDFLKILKHQIHENTSSGSRVIPCGQTDGQTEK